MLQNYHIHTTLCGHAEGALEDYIIAAIQAGLDEIGISDHSPLFINPQFSLPIRELCMKPEELQSYVDMVHRMQDLYSGKISIKLGIEADYTPENMSFFDHAAHIDFDYIIGSIHFIDGWGFDQAPYAQRFDSINLYEFYRKYVQSLEEMAVSGLFDIIGHLDIPKRFGQQPDDTVAVYRSALDAIAKNGCAVEINTSGIYTSRYHEQYPGEQLIIEIVQRGIPWVTGTDAHTPDHIARGLDEVRQILKRNGVTELAVYSQRTRTMAAL